jgi:hypothetical protein
MKFQKAQQVLKTSLNVWAQVTSPFNLYEGLCVVRDFETYAELHQKYLSCFTNLIATLRSTGHFKVQELENADRAPMICEKLIPRIYICMLIAFGHPTPLMAREVIGWVPRGTHTLQQFMLRFTILSLYPLEFNDAISVVLDQLKKFSADVSQLTELLPDDDGPIGVWLDSAIRASNQSSGVIEAMVDCATQHRSFDLLASHALATISVIPSAEKLEASLPVIQRVLSKVHPTQKLEQVDFFDASNQPSKMPLSLRAALLFQSLAAIISFKKLCAPTTSTHCGDASGSGRTRVSWAQHRRSWGCDSGQTWHCR